MKLQFTASARSDLWRLRDFIAQENPDAAATVSRRLLDSILRLREHSKLGHIIPEYDDLRDWVSGPYVVRYRVEGKRLIILRVWHGREGR